MAKQESERKRKQAESSNAEMSLKLAELERVSSDYGDKCKKLGVRFYFYTFLATDYVWHPFYDFWRR